MEDNSKRRKPKKFLKLFSDEFLRLPARLNSPLHCYLGLRRTLGRDYAAVPPVVNVFMLPPGMKDPGQGSGMVGPVQGSLEDQEMFDEWEDAESVHSDSTDDLIVLGTDDLLFQQRVADALGDPDALIDPEVGGVVSDDEMSEDEVHVVQFWKSFVDPDDTLLENAESARLIKNGTKSPSSQEQLLPARSDPGGDFGEGRKSSQNLKKLHQRKLARQERRDMMQQMQELKNLQLEKFRRDLQGTTMTQCHSLSLSFGSSFSAQEDQPAEEEYLGLPRRVPDKDSLFSNPDQGTRDKSDETDAEEKDPLEREEQRDEKLKKKRQTFREGKKSSCSCCRSSEILSSKLRVPNNTREEDLFDTWEQESVPASLVVEQIAAKTAAICREILPEIVQSKLENKALLKDASHGSLGAISETVDDVIEDTHDIPFPKFLGNLVVAASEEGHNFSEKKAASLDLPLSLGKIRTLLHVQRHSRSVDVENDKSVRVHFNAVLRCAFCSAYRVSTNSLFLQNGVVTIFDENL